MNRRDADRKNRLKTAIIALAVVLAAIHYAGVTYKDRKSTAVPENGAVIIFADVGQGDCSVILSEDCTVMIDTGPNTSEDSLCMLLDSYGIECIDYLFISHGDEDHAGGADRILSEYKVTRIITSAAYFDGNAFSVMLAAAEAAAVPVIRAGRGYSAKCGAADIEVISPGEALYDNSNDNSLVMNVCVGSISLCYTGDAGTDAEKDIIAAYNGNRLPCTLLKTGHHGSSGSTSSAWLDFIRPEYAVISCGRNNSFGHPDATVLEKLKKNGAEIIRTDLSGDIVFVTDGVTLKRQDQ